MKNPIRKWYNDLPLRTKLSVIILLAVLIPLIAISAFLSGRFRRMIAAETIRDEQVRTARTAPLLNDVFSEIIGESRQIKAGESAPGDVPDGIVTAVRQYVDLPADDPFYENADPSCVSMDEIRGTYWYGILSSSRASSLFCPPRFLGISEREEFGQCAYVSRAWVREENDSSVPAFLVLYFSPEALRGIMTENLSREGCVSYITNDRDEMITATDQALAGIYYMGYNSIRSSLMSSNGFLEKKVLNETVYVSYYYLTQSDWYLVTVTPEAPLADQARKVLLTTAGLYLASAVLALLISIFLAGSIAKRIGTVSGQMSAVHTGPPVPIDLPVTDDEIGELVNSYNYMARTINRLMDEQKQTAEELRVAEFRSLQAQINPHFLFNTMEMINQLANQGKTKETNEAITALSRFYKLTLGTKENTQPLADEIEHIEIYTRIQNMRFDDGISLVVDVPDELLEYRIPRLTLQPIVENAILHGILEKPERKGTIVLTGWMEGNDIVLLLSDDGVGIPEDRLPKVLTGELTTGGGSRIAVVNTHRRLMAAFGKEYGLSFESTPGQGTEVTIRFPALPDEEALAALQRSEPDAPADEYPASSGKSKAGDALPLVSGFPGD